MGRNLTKSNAQFKRAVQRLPLGVASNFRYWGEDRTIYVKRGKGARIVDLDDNEYVDYRMGYGPAILGYADERVDAAAREGMAVGGVFALSTERELKVAERISKMVPAAELVRFSNSGTEAVMAGLRLARGYTGKDDYVILEGGYHGLFDAAMWFTPMDKWSQVGDPEVQTGFRVARGGVQELYGIKADLCTFAKALGNGYPISVLAGREEIMRKIGRGVAHGGTYTAYSVSLAAAEKTLQILDETDALERIADYGTRLRNGMRAVLGARGIAHSFVGHPSMSGLYFAHEPPRNYRAWKSSDYSFYDAMAQVLHDEGVLCEPDSREPWFVSAAHDASCLKDTLDAFEIAVDATLRSSRANRKVPA